MKNCVLVCFYDISNLDRLGPLLAVKHFDISCIKICSMHCLNLGLLYTSNGGSLIHGKQKIGWFIWILMVWWHVVVMCFVLFQLRMTLVQLSYFGNADVVPLKDLLIEAWEDYKIWTKENKLCAPTNRWTPGVVSCFKFRVEGLYTLAYMVKLFRCALV